MLVLSRQRDESIVIGDNIITITVVDIRGDKVRLGITCPKEISVHRREVYEAILRHGEQRNGGKIPKSTAGRPISDDNATEDVLGGHATEDQAVQE